MTTMWKLPETWVWSTSLEVCKSVRDGTHDTPKYVSSGIPLVTSRNLTGGRIDFTNTKFISLADHDEIEKRSGVESGDILIAMIGTIGNPVVVDKKFDFSIKNIGLFKKDEKKISPSYLRYWLDSRPFMSWLTPRLRGTTQKFASLSILRSLPVPVPPLDEQHRIVTKIKTLFSELDNGINSLKTAREQLKVYRQAVLKHAFDGKLTARWRERNKDKLETPQQLLDRIQQERQARYQQQLVDWQAAIKAWEENGKDRKKPGKPTPPATVRHPVGLDLKSLPSGWCWVEYAGLCERIRNGISAKPEGESGTKIFRISAVRAMEFALDDVRYIQDPEGLYEDYYLAQGDLIFSRYNGSRNYVGVCAAYNGDGSHVYPDKLIQTRLGVQTVSSAYLEASINCGEPRRFIDSRIRTTAGQSGISGGDIKAMPVPICGAEEQKQIEQYLSEKIPEIDRMAAEVAAAILRSETLRQSILKKAFSGQLVPQDPNDEPASVLLARIQAERDSLLAKPKTPPKRSPKASKATS